MDERHATRFDVVFEPSNAVQIGGGVRLRRREREIHPNSCQNPAPHVAMSKKPPPPLAKSFERLGRTIAKRMSRDDPSVLAFLERSEEEGNYHEHVGRIAIHWTTFELAVDVATLRLADIHLRKGLCLTLQVAGIGRKLSAFISIAKLTHLPEDILRKF
jgi:hypothetical protein